MIQVSNLGKRYGKKTVLQEISFTAQCGECVAVVGRNGCGKTTLMQILAGILWVCASGSAISGRTVCERQLEIMGRGPIGTV